VKAAAVLLAAAALLAGCGSLPPAGEAAGQRIAGRLAIQVAGIGVEPARQLAAGFELRGSAARGALDLISPLGLLLAQARWQPGGAELEQGGQTQVYASTDELAAMALGQALPLEALFDWLRGRPWPGAPASPTAEGFAQLGWQVDTRALPEGRLLARRDTPPAVTLRVRLEAPG
jgi:outer membrane lipoprotein LolB